MRSVSGLVAGAVLLALAGVLVLTAARADSYLADAQELMATMRYDEAAASLAEAEGSLVYARWVPWLGNRAVREVAARTAALQYWRREYGALVPEGDPVAAVDENNVPLQFVVANAVFRSNLAKTARKPAEKPSPARIAEERVALVQALEEAAAGYLTVLKGPQFHEDAAFNYEFTIRLRDQVAKGSTPPPEQGESADLGESGAPSPATSTQGFEVYIPLESSEKTPAGGDAGKVSTKDRKG